MKLAMFTIEKIIVAYENHVRQVRRPWLGVAAFLTLIGLIFLLATCGLISDMPLDFAITLSIALICLFTAGLLALIGPFYARQQAFDRVLMAALCQAYTNDEGVRPSFALKPKPDKINIREAGLFARGASIHHRFGWGHETPSGHRYQIYASRFTIQTGQSAHVVYEGPYLIIPRPMIETGMFQIRSKGKPSVKGQRLTRVLEANQLSLFTQEGQAVSEEMVKQFEHFTAFNQQEHPHVLMATFIKQTIHLALCPQKNFFKPFKPTPTTLQAYLKRWHALEQSVDRLLEG